MWTHANWVAYRSVDRRDLEVFSIVRDAQQRRVKVVELTGIEPVTSCMPCKRSPN